MALWDISELRWPAADHDDIPPRASILSLPVIPEGSGNQA